LRTRSANANDPATCRYSLNSALPDDVKVAIRDLDELARVMGMSVAMIEHHYGALVDRAQQGILDRLDRLEAPEAQRSRR
jgi:hypothetical protein